MTLLLLHHHSVEPSKKRGCLMNLKVGQKGHLRTARTGPSLLAMCSGKARKEMDCRYLYAPGTAEASPKEKYIGALWKLDTAFLGSLEKENFGNE
jgi:hypothetical protein